MFAARDRVIPCFEAAALATGTEVTIQTPVALSEIRQNRALGEEVERITKARYGGGREVNWLEWGIKDASTDFVRTFSFGSRNMRLRERAKLNREM